MDIKTINTPEQLHQAIGKFLQGDYSHENLVGTYNDALKCVARFRVDYSLLPALPRKNDPLDGLQDVMEWCIKSSKVVDDIVFNLERQTISAAIGQFKKLKNIASRARSLVNSKLREQAQKEARAKVENEYKNLNEKASGLNVKEMTLGDQVKIFGELNLEQHKLLRRETEDIVQIYLSKDPTFKDKISQLHDEEVNKTIEALNKLVGSDTPTGKLLDIYCKLKDIPLQQQFNDVGYACYLNDYTDMICGGCNRLYTSIDTVIKIFEEIQTKAEQRANLASLPINIEGHSSKEKTSIVNDNFIKATIKHLPYVGSWLFDVIYGVDGVKEQKKEGADFENKKRTRKEIASPAKGNEEKYGKEIGYDVETPKELLEVIEYDSEWKGTDLQLGGINEARQAAIRIRADNLSLNLPQVPSRGNISDIQNWCIDAQKIMDEATTPKIASARTKPEETNLTISQIIEQGEGHTTEFKETLEYSVRENKQDTNLNKECLKTIAAFLNTDGGTLLIGVRDNGEITGIERDLPYVQKKNEDGFQLKLRDLIKSNFTPFPSGKVDIRFENFTKETVCRVDVEPVNKNQTIHLGKDVYIRDGNTTRKLEGRDLTDWIQQRKN